MNYLFQHIKEIAKIHPNKVAVKTQQYAYSYPELVDLVNTTIIMLRQQSPKLVALYADNSPAWIIIDIACQSLNICLLPLPTFFSKQQLHHAIESSSADLLITDGLQSSASLAKLFKPFCLDLSIAQQNLSLYSRPQNYKEHYPKETGKITFTSGSTGSPKGVCLSNVHILTVATSLCSALKLHSIRHLNLLPLSTLLENIAGIYTPLLSGGTVIVLSPEETGLFGSSKLDIHILLRCLSQYQPETLILIPELLRVLLVHIQQGWKAPESLKFVAVGGAKVPPELVQQARSVGLPIYEGYGLSECASVVCLNTLKNDKAGSVGKPLTHTELVIEKNEVIIKQPLFLGYLNQIESWYPTRFKTGDIASQDQQGFIQIEGRKKNVLISSFGRNISPEWLESELLNHFTQAIVFGDSRPYCIALLSPYKRVLDDNTIQIHIDSINQNLPDYAQIKQWIRLEEPLSYQNGLLTETGKPKRDLIYLYYQKKIEQLYQGE